MTSKPQATASSPSGKLTGTPASSKATGSVADVTAPNTETAAPSESKHTEGFGKMGLAHRKTTIGGTKQSKMPKGNTSHHFTPKRGQAPTGDAMVKHLKENGYKHGSLTKLNVTKKDGKTKSEAVTDIRKATHTQHVMHNFARDHTVLVHTNLSTGKVEHVKHYHRIKYHEKATGLEDLAAYVAEAAKKPAAKKPAAKATSEHHETLTNLGLSHDHTKGFIGKKTGTKVDFHHYAPKNGTKVSAEHVMAQLHKAGYKPGNPEIVASPKDGKAASGITMKKSATDFVKVIHRKDGVHGVSHCARKAGDKSDK